jgi:hypothetical protein
VNLRLFIVEQTVIAIAAITWTAYGIQRKNARYVIEGVALFVLTVFATALVLVSP